MRREEERLNLDLAIRSIERTTGQRIRGWIVRSFPSVNTRELLVEDGGFLYDSGIAATTSCRTSSTPRAGRFS